MRDNLLFAQAGLVSCYLIHRSLHGKAGFPMNAIRFAATGESHAMMQTHVYKQKGKLAGSLLLLHSELIFSNQESLAEAEVGHR